MRRAGVDKRSLRDLQRAIQRQPRLLETNLKRHFKLSGQEWQGKMLDRFRGTPMKTRTGALKRSIRYRVPGSKLSNIELRAFSTSRYAKVHEYGTVGKGGRLPDITPKRSKALTIPLPDNLTPAGVPRFPSARALMSSGKTFLHTSDRGITTIALDEGGRLRWLWVLKKRVSIPARLGFFLTWEGLRRGRLHRLRRATRAALQGRAL